MFRIALKSLVLAAMFIGLAGLAGCNGARDDAVNSINNGPTGFMVKQLARGDRHRNYGLFVPRNYSATKQYPVIIFLHGIGETGSDAHANMRVGLAPFVADQASSFPFICIFPQSNGGWDENSEEAADIFTALDDVAKSYNVDRDRVSLTGLSTGGVGTWAIGGKYKNVFAALVPMGSNGTADKWVPELVDMNIRAYCNGGDMFAGFGGNDRGMVEKVKTAGGRNAEFTLTDGPGHDCWEGVYSSGELFSWLEVQRRRGTAAAPATPASPRSSITPAHPAGTSAVAPANPVY